MNISPMAYKQHNRRFHGGRIPRRGGKRHTIFELHLCFGHGDWIDQACPRLPATSSKANAKMKRIAQSPAVVVVRPRERSSSRAEAALRRGGVGCVQRCATRGEVRFGLNSSQNLQCGSWLRSVFSETGGKGC